MVGLTQLALAPMKDVPCQVVASLVEVAHALDLAAVLLFVDVEQHVQGLVHPPEVGEGVAELGQVAAA